MRISDLSSDVCSSDSLLLARGARRHLLAEREHDFAGFGIDHIEHRLLAAPLLGLVRDAPTLGIARPADTVVEMVQDVFRLHPQRTKQRSQRQLAFPVYAAIDDVFGCELKIQPRTDTWDDPDTEERRG